MSSSILTARADVNPNIEHALRFLHVLGADERTSLHWQLVRERLDRLADPAARPSSFSGSFAEVCDRLIAANGAGDAVFAGITLMAEDAPARRAEFDRGSRVMALDLDGAPMPTWDNCVPAPHLISETSPGRYHCLWRLAETLPPVAWQAQQRRLAARFGGDLNIGKPAQTLRVPGFLHQKAAPFRCRIVARRDDPPIHPVIFIEALTGVEPARTGTGGTGGFADVVVDERTGLVVDGREAYLTQLVWRAFNDNPDASADELKALVWRECCRTMSLRASRAHPSPEAIQRKIADKIRHLLRKDMRQRARVEAEVPPWAPPPELEPAAAQERMRAVIRDHLETHTPRRTDPDSGLVPYDPAKPRPRTALVATAGLGKSTSFLEVLADLAGDFDADPPNRLWYVTATFALARELAEKARAARLSAIAIRGRTYTSGPDDPPLCARSEVVKAITAAGVTNIRSNLCEKDKDPEEGANGDSVTLKCIHFDNCPYWQQFEPAHIYFLTHEYLFLRPTDKLLRPDYVVIDELPLTAFFVERHCAPEAIINTAHDVEPIVRAAIDDFRRAVDPRERLRRAGIGAAALREMAQAIQKRPEYDVSAAVWPHFADEVILRHLNRRKVPWAARFLDAIAEEMDFGRDRVAGVRYRRRVADDDGSTREWFEFQRPAMIKVKHSVPMLMLDGTANPTLVDEFFTDHEKHRGDNEMTPDELNWRRTVGFVEINARRSAHITQITNFSASKRNLLRRVDADGFATNADKYMPIIFKRLPRDESILFVTYKTVEDYILGSERLRALVPTNVQLAHFGAIRGRDVWKHVGGVVVLGRNLPPADDVERIALALRAGRDVPLPLVDVGFERTAVRWHAKDGRGAVTHDWRHPDPLVEAIRWSICDAETMQAADRARLVWPDGPKFVLLFNNTPTIAADELIPFERWLGLSPDPLARFGELVRRENGVARLSTKRLAAAHPDLFATERVVKRSADRITANPPAEVPTGIAMAPTVPVQVMVSKVRGEPGPAVPTLTTLPGRLTAVKISRDAGADAWVEEPKPSPENLQPDAVPKRGPRHYVMRADPVEVEIPPKLDQNS